MKHQIKIGIISLFMPSLLWAGGSVGNGGGTWTCRELNNEIRWTKFVDLYEAENEFGLDLDVNPTATIEDNLDKVLAKTKLFNRSFYYALKASLQKVKQNIKVVDNANLSVIDDALFRITPLESSCAQGKLAYEQLANYTTYGKILLNSQLWSRLSVFEKAGLYLHEAIYLLERTRKNASNSVNTRRLVGLLMSQFDFNIYKSDLEGYEPALNTSDCDVCVSYLPKKGERFSEELAAFRGDKGLWGYVDTSGKVVIAPQYEQALPFSEGRAAVSVSSGKNLAWPDLLNNYKWVYIDIQNNVIFDTQSWIIPGTFQKGLAQITLEIEKHKFKTAIINLDGKFVFDYSYNSVNLNDGVVLFLDHDAKTCEYYDGQKNLLLKLVGYDYCDNFSEGLAVVKQNNLDGFVNIKGEVVIAPQFKESRSFINGYAVVQINDTDTQLGSRYAVINKKGDYVFAPFQARQAYSFNNLVVARYYKTSEGNFVPVTVLNLDGQQISKIGFAEILYIGHNLADLKLIPVKYNGLWGYMDLNGQMIVTPQFTQADYFYNGFAVTDKGYISLKDIL